MNRDEPRDRNLLVPTWQSTDVMRPWSVWRRLALLLAFLAPACPVRADAVCLTTSSGNSVNPSVARGLDGDVRVAWADNRDRNYDIYYALADAFGSRLTPDVRVTNTASSSTVPRIGVDGLGFAYICWREANNVWIVKLDPQGGGPIPACK